MLVLNAILGLALGMLLAAQYYEPRFGSHYKNGGPFKTLQTQTREETDEAERQREQMRADLAAMLQGKREQRRVDLIGMLQGKEIDPADLPLAVLEQLVEKYR
ncbi:TPA: hypothetical protein HA265_06090 [Candidatus Woesearchaeota archaeon]|nr:hypothetical protein [Candidatus Woesearchaeota archaeon]